MPRHCALQGLAQAPWSSQEAKAQAAFLSVSFSDFSRIPAPGLLGGAQSNKGFHLLRCTCPCPAAQILILTHCRDLWAKSGIRTGVGGGGGE